MDFFEKRIWPYLLMAIIVVAVGSIVGIICGFIKGVMGL